MNRLLILFAVFKENVDNTRYEDYSKSSVMNGFPYERTMYAWLILCMNILHSFIHAHVKFRKNRANINLLPTEDAYSSGHLVLFLLGLAFVLPVETSDMLYRLDIIPVCDIIIGHNIITEFDISPNISFHRASATGVACQQGTLTPPDTWSCPTLGLAYVLMSRPISPELVLSPDFWISNTLRYFSFA